MMSERRFWRVLLGAAIAAVAFALAGCASGGGSASLRNADLPRGNQPLGPSVWMAAGEPGPAQDWWRWQFAPLPHYSAKNHFEIDASRRTAASSHYRMVGLGVPYAYLPLEFSFSRRIYERGTEEPVGSLVRRWSPFWSSQHIEGAMDDVLVVDVSGIPLLWERGYEKGPSWYFDDFVPGFDDTMEFSFFTLLWWIGPMEFRLNREWTDEDGRPAASTARYFAPLFLGRGPGFLLWSDYREVERSGGARTETRGHGPLFGYPLYWSRRTRPEEGGARLDRLVLGGILWNDRVQRDDSLRTTDSAHGPLWGAFGWGKKDGRPAARIFWLPVAP